MKATGIVRQVDDLGRVVIPKEIRRMLGINTGDPVEFYVENDGVIVKRYDAAGDMEQVLDHLEKIIEFKGSLLAPDQQGALVAKLQEMKSIVKSTN